MVVAVISVFSLLIFGFWYTFQSIALNPPTQNPPTGGGAIGVASDAPANSLYMSSAGDVGIGTTTPGYKLDISGDINFTGKLREDGVEIFSGMIVPFAGSCPTGWTEYTVARGRTVVGQDTTQTEFDVIGETGGEKTHVLTTSEIPAHTHTSSGSDVSNDDTCISVGTGGTVCAAHLGAGTGSAGGGAAHNNLQPYIVLVYCQKSAGADLAEWTPSSQPIEKTSIVSIDPDNTEKIIISSQEYDSTVIGIISSNPGWLIGTEDQNSVQMALAGRVLTKVTLKNGEINHGDPITTATIPGTGMKAIKAGPIVGKAIEAFNEISSTYDCQDPATGRTEKCGTILVFVNVSWYDPDVYLTSTGELKIVASGSSYIAQHTTTGNIIDKIGAFAELVTGKLRVGLIETKKLIVDGVDLLQEMRELKAENNALQARIEAIESKLK